MKKKYKLVILILTGIAFAIILYFFSIKLAKVSVNDDYREFSSENVNDSLHVFIDQYKIPHIIAKNENDAFFAMGYLHAKDRLWQMDYLRRFGKGELAEILGEDYLMVDKFIKAVGITKTSYRIAASMDIQTKKILESYKNGINFYLKSNEDALPFEFNALSYIPKEWKIEDCIIVQRIIAFSQSKGFFDDITFGEISERIGIDNSLKLIPNGHYDDLNQMDSTFSIKVKSIDTLKQIKKDSISNNVSNPITGLFNELSINLATIKNKLNLKGSVVGSNSWAIKKSKNSAKTGAILANDPHQDYTVPANWYQVHISCPQINAFGLNIPGTPFLSIGRNNNISWGVTNLMIDDVDFFVEKIDSVDKNFYWNSAGVKTKFDFRKDTIKVKGRNPEIYYQRFTKNSCVISDFIFNKDFQKNPDDNKKYLEKYCLTFTWTGNYKSDELTTLYKILKTKDWDGFLSTTESWGAPGIVFSYADSRGNVGLNPSGFVPIRHANNPNLPSPNWIADNAWEGVRNSSQLPKQYNPVKGFVISANNKLSKNSAFYITSNWAAKSRAERISDVLAQYMDFSARDAQILQNDYYSVFSHSMIDLILPLLEKNSAGMSELEKKGVLILKYWDNFLSSNDPSGSIYTSFMVNLCKNIFLDELGDWLYNQYSSNTSMVYRRTYEILNDTLETFIDDVRTPLKENKEIIIVNSFKNSIKELHDLFDNDNPYEWLYGKIHKVSMKHNFTDNFFFKPAVTFGPFEIGGDFSTVNCNEYKLNSPYSSVLGPSVRFVADMEDSIVYSVIPGGVSGEPLSNNFSDQLQVYLNGGYIKTNISPKVNYNENKYLSFYPKKK